MFSLHTLPTFLQLQQVLPVLAGGPQPQLVPGLIEGVAGPAGADHPPEVGGALLLAQTVLGSTRVL